MGAYMDTSVKKSRCGICWKEVCDDPSECREIEVYRVAIREIRRSLAGLSSLVGVKQDKKRGIEL